MSRPQRFPQIALLSLMLFGALTYFSLPSGSGLNGRTRSAFLLEVELSGTYDALALDFAAVQDTFANQVGLAVALSPIGPHAWRLDESPGGQLRGHLRLGFSSEEMRDTFALGLLAQSGLDLQLLAQRNTGTFGLVSADLPVPGRTGEVLALRSWRFRAHLGGGSSLRAS